MDGDGLKAYKRLDGNVMPENYRLHFDTNMRTFRFSGSEEITVEIKKPSREIRMYANGLEIKSASVLCKGKTVDAKASYIGKTHCLVLVLPKAVSGKATIAIAFSGGNNDQMYGFYRSAYLDGKKKRYIITSDFEPTDARAMFPCFDEPSFKATFDVSVAIDRGMKAVSNMPIKSERPFGNGRREVRFMATPRMSTYIFHLSVGDFNIHSKKSGSLEIRLVSPRSGVNPDLPLDYAERFIRFYESYFGIRYPLPKIDMIALPDFRAGAMENWGAITFREGRLLGDESTPVAIKERIAEVIAHEFAHQWFGDLVTMRWWEDLWLNESFATFMSHKAMQASFPEWNMRDRFLDMVAALAFPADSVKSTHPISVKVDDAEHIGELFDEISYEKGCMVLHMVEDYVGQETFRKGLHRYLMEHRHGNASKEDLWNALREECRREGRKADVAALVRSWIEQPGHPVITAKGWDRQRLEQHRFTVYGAPADQKWVVPVKYADEGGKRGVSLMKDRIASVPVKSPVKLNIGQDYFYRVEYGKPALSALGEMVKRGSLGYRDGWGLENDLFAFMLAGRASLDDYLEFIDRYCIGSGYPLAFNTSMHLAGLRGVLYSTDRKNDIEQLSVRFHKRMMDECGMEWQEGEPNTVTLLRSRAFSNLGILGHAPVVETARRFMGPRNRARMPPDLRASVYAVVAWNGSTGTFDELKGMYSRAADAAERVRLLQALAMFSTPKEIKRSLDFSVSSDVRLQDSVFIPLMTSGIIPSTKDGIRMELNPAGSAYLWPWVRGNWQMLERKFTVETHILDKLLKSLSTVSDRSTFGEIEHFFAGKAKPRPDISRSLAATKDSIRANINFMERNGLRIIKPHGI